MEQQDLDIALDDEGGDNHIDSILDVTPVNTEEEAPSTPGSNAESPLLSSLLEDADTSPISQSASQISENNKDSSSDDNDVDKSAESTGSRSHSRPSEQQSQSESEWDKALMTGKASKGRASDFFVPHQPALSTDSSEFYSTSQAARATLPGALKPHVSPLQARKSPLYRQQLDVSSPVAQPSNATQLQQPPPPPPLPQASTRSIQSQSTVAQTPSAPPLNTKPTVAPTLNTNSATGQGSTVVHVQKDLNNKYYYSAQRSSSTGTVASGSTVATATTTTMRPQDYYPTEEDLSAGVLPDVLMSMRQKIESLTMFDSDILRYTADQAANDDDDPMFQESRESLKRSSQQSISAAVLVSLAHKRYERRRLAAMEIEKVVRSLVVLQHQTKQQKNELDRVRAILLLLSDDYVRSTSEDARKGGVVALAACAIGLKKANDSDPVVQECRDLILASVVHACQDHSQRVRYYATESLFNVVKGKYHTFIPYGCLG
jgi:Vacuolar 14 Fab1-binding region